MRGECFDYKKWCEVSVHNLLKYFLIAARPPDRNFWLNYQLCSRCFMHLALMYQIPTHLSVKHAENCN